MIAFDKNQLGSRTFRRQTADGTFVEWKQEDESAVTCKAEGVAMVQRTIDFWLPMMVSELQRIRRLSFADAKKAAEFTFLQELETMLDEPFPKQWGMSLDDFVLHFS